MNSFCILEQIRRRNKQLTIIIQQDGNMNIYIWSNIVLKIKSELQIENEY